MQRVRAVLTAGAVLFVMFLAVFVRVPHYTADQPADLIDRDGLPYFSEMDAYYHVRMADEVAENGVYGLTVNENGERWDPLRYAPDGKTARYHEGIVRVSVALWRFLRHFSRVDLHTVDYYLSCLFAALTVPVLFLFGKCTTCAALSVPALSGKSSAAVSAGSQSAEDAHSVHPDSAGEKPGHPAAGGGLSGNPSVPHSFPADPPAVHRSLASLSAVSTLAGLLAAVLAVCAPAFVERTMAGTFDTDMAQILLASLLLFLMAQTLLSGSYIRAAVCAVGMAAVTGAYTLFWSRGLAFAGIAFLGGGLYLLGAFIFGRKRADRVNSLPLLSCRDAGGDKAGLLSRRDTEKKHLKAACFGYILCLFLMLTGILILQGPSYIRFFMQSLSYVSTEDVVSGMPNRYSSIAEMQVPPFAPGQISQWFAGYFPGEQMTIVTGVGGIAALLAAIVGLGILFAGASLSRKSDPEAASPAGASSNDAFPAESDPEAASPAESSSNDAFLAGSSPEAAFPAKSIPNDTSSSEAGAKSGRPAVWFFLLLLWFEACLYAAFKGERFIMHLAAPAGILAGVAAGLAICRILTWRRRRDAFAKTMGVAAVVILCMLLILPSVSGSYRLGSRYGGLVSDCAESTADWIAANARSENAVVQDERSPRGRGAGFPKDAVIVSWWDLGYYYEYEAGIPVLWDGGSQDEIRSILVGRALTTRDFYQSSELLKMLATSGNRVAWRLNGRLGQKEGFGALWELSAMSRAEAEAALNGTYGFLPEEADEISSMIHPEKSPEIYLVITERMMQVLGWIEYYGNWDFSGEAPIPLDPSYLASPEKEEGSAGSDRSAEDIMTEREQEVIWQLYFQENVSPRFRQVFETEDGMDRACVLVVE